MYTIHLEKLVVDDDGGLSLVDTVVVDRLGVVQRQGDESESKHWAVFRRPALHRLIIRDRIEELSFEADFESRCGVCSCRPVARQASNTVPAKFIIFLNTKFLVFDTQFPVFNTNLLAFNAKFRIVSHGCSRPPLSSSRKTGPL